MNARCGVSLLGLALAITPLMACGGTQRVELSVPHAAHVSYVERTPVAVTLNVSCERVQAGPGETQQVMRQGAVATISQIVLESSRSRCSSQQQRALEQTLLERIDRGLRAQGLRRDPAGPQRLVATASVQLVTAVGGIEAVNDAEQCQAACEQSSCVAANHGSYVNARVVFEGMDLPALGVQRYEEGRTENSWPATTGQRGLFCSASQARAVHRSVPDEVWLRQITSVGRTSPDYAFMDWVDTLPTRIRGLDDMPRVAAAIEDEDWVTAFDRLSRRAESTASSSERARYAYYAAIAAMQAGALDEASEWIGIAVQADGRNAYRELMQEVADARRHAIIHDARGQ